MPSSKNPIARILIIDQLLRESHSKPMTLEEICDKVNERLLGDIENQNQLVSLRTIRADIDMMKSEFDASINKRAQHHKGSLYFYSNPFQSIFHHGMTPDESNDVKDMLSKLRRFIGHEQFRFLIQGERRTSPFNSLLRLVSPMAKPINKSVWNQNGFVLFDSASASYRGGRNIEGLAEAIADESMVLVTYKPYGKPKEVIEFFPFVLKQYNNRWNCIGEDINPHPEVALNLNTNPYRNLALDRVEKIARPSKAFITKKVEHDPLFQPIKSNPIKDWEGDVFQHVVGSSIPLDQWKNRLQVKAPTRVKIAVSPEWLPFEKSRPIHKSFKVIHGKFHFNGWVEAEYRLLPNREFYSQLAHRAGNVIVLSPLNVVDEAKGRIERARDQYRNITPE